MASFPRTKQHPPVSPPLPPNSQSVTSKLDNDSAKSVYNSLAAVDRHLADEIFQNNARPCIVKIQCEIRRYLARKQVETMLLEAFEVEEELRRKKRAQQISDGLALVEMSTIEQSLADSAILEQHRNLASTTESEKALKVWSKMLPDSSISDAHTIAEREPIEQVESKKGRPVLLNKAQSSEPVDERRGPQLPKAPRPKYVRRPNSKSDVNFTSSDGIPSSSSDVDVRADKNPALDQGFRTAAAESLSGVDDENSSRYGSGEESSGGRESNQSDWDGDGSQGQQSEALPFPDKPEDMNRNSSYWIPRVREFQCKLEELERLSSTSLETRALALESLLHQISNDLMKSFTVTDELEESAGLLRITAQQLIERINPGGIDIRTGGQKKKGWAWAPRNTTRKHYTSM